MKKRIAEKRSQTDWKRVDAIKDAEVDLSDTREVSPEMFAHGILRRGLKPLPPKSQLTLRLDKDVLD
jgi:uncharacterized protein (DUF4415 family)